MYIKEQERKDARGKQTRSGQRSDTNSTQAQEWLQKHAQG